MNQSVAFYREIFTSASVGMVVCDDSGRCIEANEAMGKIIGGTREDVLSQNYHHMKSWEETDILETILCVIKTNQVKYKEVTLATSLGRQVSLDFHIIPFAEDERNYLLIIVYDITERKRAELVNEALIEKLQKAIDEIKTLKGIIPICASCKQIRDDEGFWNQLEQFIMEHSDAVFSHGICPSCAKKLYPRLGPNKDKEE